MLPFTNRTVNFAEVPLWDYPDWILPHEPITEEEAMDYPWNWDFDEFKRRMTKFNKEEIKDSYKSREPRDELLHSQHDEEFLQWLRESYGIDIQPEELEIKRPHPSKRSKDYVHIKKPSTTDKTKTEKSSKTQ